MPSASSLFSAVFGFRKVVLEIFSELDTTKTEVPIFPGSTWKSEEESKTGTRGATPCPGAGPPLAMPGLGVGPPGAHRHRPFAYIFSPTRKPYKQKPPSMKSSVAAAVVNPSLGDRNLCSVTLPGRELPSEAISIDSTAILITVDDSHDEE